MLEVAVLGLFFSHLFKMVRNLTSNEMVNEKRFAYLSLNPYKNPFDLGADNNVREFFSGFPRERERWDTPIQVKTVLPADLDEGRAANKV